MVFDAKILSFLSLLIIQVLISIVYKFSQTKGKYTYSPLSAIASAEFIKLCLSFTLLLCSVSIDEITTTYSFSKMISNRLSVCYRMFNEEVKNTFIVYTFVLALLYVINNQLSFILYLYVDMASISMFKSFSSFISAILLWGLFERNLSNEQWCSIILQVAGLCIVQYDSCQNSPFLDLKYYFILFGSTLITGICSVWNERLIKTHSVNIHIQNAILYSFGLILNLSIFFILPDLFGESNAKKHFFEGYSLSVYGIILCNSVIGIVITFVYKYADAIVKTFSTACATGVLLYINVAVFELKANLTVYLGAIVIFVSSYLFLSVKSTPTISPSNPDPQVNPIPNQKTESTWKSIWKQSFKWKCQLLGFVSGSLVLYFATSLFRNGTLFHTMNKFYLTSTTSLSPNITRIEEIRLNHSIVIHGVNLCNEKTLKSTRVLINSSLCFPIDTCTNRVLSCYLPHTLNNELLPTTVNISLTTSVEGPSTSIMMNTTTRYSKSLSYWEKSDVVLVIHFNVAHYERIPFLRIYRNLFPLVLFTGPKSHPDVIDCPEAEGGNKPYLCLSRAVLLHPNHTGYLLFHFDVLPIFYNLENENLKAFWIPPIECMPKANGWWWWPLDNGLRALNKTFDEIKVNVQNTTFHGRYAANYQNNTGWEICKTYTDIFYLPQRFIPDFLILTQLFGKHGVFHEIAFPTITYMIIPTNASQNLETLLGKWFEHTVTLESLKDPPSLQFVHKIDHNNPDKQNLIKITVQRSLKMSTN